MNRRLGCTARLTILLALSTATNSHAQLRLMDGTGTESFVKLYFVETVGADIRTYDPDGSNVRRLTAGRSQYFNPKDIEIDIASGKMYYTSPTATGAPAEGTRVQRANLDGSDPQDIATFEDHGLVDPFGIALDIPGGKVYWTDRDTCRIQRANLNGSDVEDVLVTSPDEPVGIALDVLDRRMYWTLKNGPSSPQIQRAPMALDPVAETLVDGLLDPVDIDLDGQGFMYWTDRAANTINRAEIADPVPTSTPIVSMLDNPEGISVDDVEQQVYWLDAGTRKIQRANLDGTVVVDLVDNSGVPDGGEPLLVTSAARGLFVEPATARLYWVDANQDTVFQADTEIPAGEDAMNRTDIETVLTRADGLLFPRRVAIDLPGGKMYWTETGVVGFPGFTPPKIQRANLDGTHIEDLVTQNDLSDLENPNGVALDLSSDPQKIYWTEDVSGNGKIRRANLDGSAIETLLSALGRPREIALDVANGLMYWAERESSEIRRAAIAVAPVIETLYDATDGLVAPNGIALDVDSTPDMVYWSDLGTMNITRAQADGADGPPLEVVVESNLDVDVIGPQSIALDVANNTLYWTDGQTNQLGRAELDGGGAEVLVTLPDPPDQFSPQGIALDLALIGDADGDGIDADGDGSGVPQDTSCMSGMTRDCDDNCPTVSNSLQADIDADGLGDLCDPCPSTIDNSSCIVEGSTAKEVAVDESATIAPDNLIGINIDGGDLPAGDHTVSITEQTDPAAPVVDIAIGPGQGLGIALGRYDINIEPDVSFSDTVTVTMVRNISGLTPEQQTKLGIYTLDSQQLFVLHPTSQCTLNVDVATCTVELEHASTIAVVAVDAADGCLVGGLPDCADLDDNGIRDDNCVWWECVQGTCASVDVPFADMGGSFGKCPPDGTADGNDRFHALNCFANQNPDGSTPYDCEAAAPAALNIDAGGPFGSCNPDGVCDGNDAFHVLSAFGGATTCSCPLDGDPMPEPGKASRSRTVGRTELSLVSSVQQVHPGEHIEIAAILDNAVHDLRGYQLHIAVSGGVTGTLRLTDVAIDDRSDHVFAGHPDWRAFNVDSQQVLAGLDSPGIAAQPGAYLATFTFQATGDARGTFVIDVLRDSTNPQHRTFLFPTPVGAGIDIARVTPVVIELRTAD